MGLSQLNALAETHVHPAALSKVCLEQPNITLLRHVSQQP
jgi:hypothetical protein